MKVELYLLLVLVVVAISARRFRRSTYETLTCDSDYDEISGHSLCLDDNPDMTASGVTSAVGIVITNKHNTLRKLPTATDMMKMHWDSRLADVAQKWANQCPSGHESSATKRSVIDIGITVGQNVASGYATWDAAIQAWYDEVNDFQYGVPTSTYPEEVKHYTQVVQRDSFLIGCGYAECSSYPYYVCNYVGPNSDTATPYTDGTDCAACPNQCTDDDLCDCNGHICQNGGTLNINTCQCSCPEHVDGVSLYTGNSCENLICPADDRSICGIENQWGPSNCTVYYNVPWGCPYMCGLCDDSDRPCDGMICENGGTLDATACTCACQTPLYSGDTCETKNCPIADHANCGTVWTDCSPNSNIPTDFCPYMCSLCDDSDRPCNGKVCENGGTLDITACTCTCDTPFYSGDTCETKNCPVADHLNCGNGWPQSYCTQVSNFGPDHCPYLCGLCY